MKQVDPALLQVAVDAVANLKEPIDTVSDPRYMDRVVINGEINNIITSLNSLNELKYGCFCDVEYGAKPDPVCVMDACYDGPLTDCIYATKGGDKFKCSEWKAYLPE